MADIKAPAMLTCLLTENDCFKTGRKITPTGIVYHSTGANNPSIRRYVQPVASTPGADILLAQLGKNPYNNHWNQSSEAMGRQVCCHAFIGKLADSSVGICQTLPWNHRGWHAGGSANNSYIGFEVCEDDKTDESYLKAVYELTAQLCAWLCSTYGIDPSNILGHYEAAARGMASGHADPRHWFKLFGLSMDSFRERVSQLLAGAEGIVIDGVYSDAAAQPGQDETQPTGSSTAGSSTVGSSTAGAPTDETQPTASGSIGIGSIVEFTDGSSTYTPGGKAIPAWARSFYHRVTKATFRNRPRVVNGATCVCLGEMRLKTAAINAPFAPGMSTWVDMANLRLLANGVDAVEDGEGEGETGASEAADGKASQTYTVADGDSLFGISKRLLGNGARFTEIKAMNGFTTNIIYPGQSLKVPSA